MPEENLNEAPKIERSALEADIDLLAGEITRHKEVLDQEKPDHREILKQAIRNIAPTPLPPTAPSASNDSPYLPAYASSVSPEVKLEIEYLVDLALREGIAKANAAAADSNPFVMDAFHDALAGKIYPELKRRKILD